MINRSLLWSLKQVWRNVTVTTNRSLLTELRKEERYYSLALIGGYAYSAPVVAVKTNGGEAVYYYLLLDYLGIITHVVDATSNSVVAEYSYDSWGRMRNPVTWENYPPGS